MIDILRSIVCADIAEAPQAEVNVTKVRADRLLAIRPTTMTVLMFVQDFYTKYTQVPTLRTLRDFADGVKNPEITKIIDDVETGAFYAGADFEQLLEREVQEQGLRELNSVCREAIGLVTSGKKSLEEAIGFLYTTIRIPSGKDDKQLPVGMKKAATGLQQLYQTRKSSPLTSYGIMTGYGTIDQSTAGIRKKQLYLHAAFPGHLKSTFLMNTIVNAAVDYGWNELLFTAEMPKDDVMLMLVAIHSGHQKFNGIHRPLNKFRLLQGQLNPEEEGFFRDVLDDLTNHPEHGSIRVVDSSEFSTFGSVMQRTIRENTEEEVDQVWVDYLTRLVIDPKYAKMSLTEARNETIADAKRFAMTFNGGKGLAVCSAFQTNRESFKQAAGVPVKKVPGKANQASSTGTGKLTKTALASYNAAEKEADVITYTWFGDDERRISEPKLGILKSRWGEETPDPVSLFIERDSRRIYDMTQGLRISATPTQAAGGSADVEI